MGTPSVSQDRASQMPSPTSAAISPGGQHAKQRRKRKNPRQPPRRALKILHAHVAAAVRRDDLLSAIMRRMPSTERLRRSQR